MSNTDTFSEIQVHFSESMLYRDKNGRQRQWKILVQQVNDSFYIKTQSGQVGGKIIEAIDCISEGKNIGRSNETDCLEQAINEAQSKLTHMRRIKGKNDFILPMLLSEYEQTKVTFPCIIQPKYNGIRALTRIINNNLTLYSRTRKIFQQCLLIKRQLVILYNSIQNKNIILDGELWSEDLELQDISSIARKELTQDLNEHKLLYCVYDVIDLNNINATFLQRHRILILIQEKIIELGLSLIKISISFSAHSYDDIELFFQIMTAKKGEVLMDESQQQQYIGQQQEGIVIRNIQGTYDLHGSRVTSILKYKSYIDAEYKCVGYTCGKKGKDKDLLMWILQTKEKKNFTVRPNATIQDRCQMYKNMTKISFEQNYYKKYFTVVHMGFTKDMIPYHIKSCVLRDYE